MTLKGGEMTGWPEISGPEVMRFLVVFFLCLMYPKLGAEETGNSETPVNAGQTKRTCSLAKEPRTGQLARQNRSTLTALLQ